MPVELNIDLEGDERVVRIIGDLSPIAREALEDQVKTIRNLVVGRTPVGEVKGGKLKRSWTTVKSTSTGFTFGTKVPYAVILEEGLYKGVGPRTVEFEGGIFSRQAPGGMITPVVEDEALIAKIVTHIAREIARGMT